MWIRVLLLLAGVLIYTNSLAAEHSACNEPDYPFWVHPASELRIIADTCLSVEVSRLYYLRAYHADLLTEGRVLAGLIPYERRGSGVDFDSYKIYMALIETMTPAWFPANQDRLDFLNKEYARRMEIAELRLHGYDHLADRLEQD